MKTTEPVRIWVEIPLDVWFCEYNDRIEVDIVRSPGQSKNLFLDLDQLSQIKIQAETEAALEKAEQERFELKEMEGDYRREVARDDALTGVW